MSNGTETPSAIQADHAWATFTKSLAHDVPKHLHNANNAVRAMRKRRTR